MSKRNSHGAKALRREERQDGRPVPAVTHEPEVALPGWPDSHARVRLTSDDAVECIAIEIHGVTHYLHSTTAAELYKALGARLREWNGPAKAAGFGVDLDDYAEPTALQTFPRSARPRQTSLRQPGCARIWHDQAPRDDPLGMQPLSPTCPPRG